MSKRLWHCSLLDFILKLNYYWKRRKAQKWPVKGISLVTQLKNTLKKKKKNTNKNSSMYIETLWYKFINIWYAKCIQRHVVKFHLVSFPWILRARSLGLCYKKKIFFKKNLPNLTWMEYLMLENNSFDLFNRIWPLF